MDNGEPPAFIQLGDLTATANRSSAKKQAVRRWVLVANRRLFWGNTAAGARHEAMVWLRDFDHEEPVALQEIRVLEAPGGFVAVVIYGEMKIVDSRVNVKSDEELQAWLWGNELHTPLSMARGPEAKSRYHYLRSLISLSAILWRRLLVTFP